jgi:hypothetical protein
MTPDPLIIRLCQRLREARRPAECRSALPCWVLTPYAAMPNGRTRRCLGCGAAPRGPNPTATELREAELR